MDRACFALPILPGKTDAARAFMNELETTRRDEYVASEQRIGIEREFWFLQQTPQGDMYVAYMESPDFGRALEMFSSSQDAFDVWFKVQLLGATGLDLNVMPSGPLSELLSSYESAMASAAP